MSPLLFTSSLLAFAGFLIHTIMGGRQMVPALFKTSELKRVQQLTWYYCWHIVSWMLLVLVIALGYLAFIEPGNRALAVVCLALILGGSVWSILLVVRSRSSPWDLLQWLLFGLISLPLIWHLASDFTLNAP
jgi:glucan phosphoethanolaminetransferase (alkaline phosphatase superfamily)